MRLSIKTKIAGLTVLLLTLSLCVSLFISYQNAVHEKKNHAEKLMVNIAKQIALLKRLRETIPHSAFLEYIQKTVHSSFSREDFSIHIVYIINTNAKGELLSFSINEKLFQTPIMNKKQFAAHLLTSESQPVKDQAIKQDTKEQLKGIRKVSIQLSANEQIQIGFSLHILKSAIISDLYFYLLLGAFILLLGIIGSLLLSKMITAPLLKLMSGLKKIESGDLDVQIHIQSGDEIQLLTDSFNQMTCGLKEREMIKDAFSRYASNQVVDKILQGEVKPILEGSLRDVTVLFADIRKFTELTNLLKAQDVVYILNQYFSAMTDIVTKYEGLLDKYTGDEVMAVYGTPIAHVDDPLRAVNSAKEMLLALHCVNAKLAERQLPKISIGIGIHSGTAIAGNIGSKNRLNYTVVGKDVNIAARLVNLAREGEICISKACYQHIKDRIHSASQETVNLKGITEPITIYRILAS